MAQITIHFGPASRQAFLSPNEYSFKPEEGKEVDKGSRPQRKDYLYLVAFMEDNATSQLALLIYH